MFWVVVSGGDKGQFFVARGQYKALLLGSWWHWPRKGGTGWYLVVLSQFRAALVLLIREFYPEKNLKVQMRTQELKVFSFITKIFLDIYAWFSSYT